LLLEVTSCQRLHTVDGFHSERQDVHPLEVPDGIWWMSLINLVYTENSRLLTQYTLQKPST